MEACLSDTFDRHRVGYNRTVTSPRDRLHLDASLILPLVARTLRTRSFVLLMVLGVAVTGALGYLARPVFQSEVALLYQDRNGANPMGTQRGEGSSPRRIGLTLKEMLFSQAVLEKLAGEFGLYGNKVSRYGMVAAIDEMRKKDLHFATHEGYTFRIAYEASSPDLAQAVTARAGELLIEAHRNSRLAEVKEMGTFLDGEKQRVEDELRERESKLAMFVTKNPEVLTVGTVQGATVDPDTGGADATAIGLEMQALQLKERLSQLRQRPSASAAPDGAKPALPREQSENRAHAETELAAAQRELAEKQAQFTEEYPDVKRARVRVEMAKVRLRHMDEAAASPSPQAPEKLPSPSQRSSPAPATDEQGETRLLQQQIDLLERQMKAVHSHGRRPPPRAGDPDALGRLRAQYIELERRARESREHLALLENRQFQAEMQALFATQAKSADIVVVDPALKPVAPVRSPRPKVLLLGAALSLFVAFSVGLLLTIRDDRLRHATDLQRFDLPPLLCEIPPP